MRFITFITYVVLLSSSLFSQVKLKDDFLISKDNSPSTFRKDLPRIFSNDTSGFIVTWTDYRSGEAEFYMQKFDSDGNPIGNNFKIDSDIGIEFGKNGSFLNIFGIETGWDTSYLFNYYLNVYGKVYDENLQSSAPFYINTAILPWCGTGWLGVNYKLTRIPEGYLFFFRNDGYVTLSKINVSGNIAFTKPLEEIPFRSVEISAASNTNSEYMLACLNVNTGGIEQNSLDEGIYAYFYNSNDSLVAKDILITNFIRNNENSYRDIPLVKSIVLSDSVYEIFWVDNDSLSLNYVRYNNKGYRLGNMESLKIPYAQLPTNWGRQLVNFTLSPIKNGSFAVYLSTKETDYYPDLNPLYYNSLFYFNSKGDLINQYYMDSSFINLGQQIFKLDSETFYTVTLSDYNVCLTKLKNFTVEGKTKINNELSGSNELYPAIIKINNQTNFITWNNERGSKGQKINSNGNLIGEEVNLKGDQCIFSPNGKILNIWTEIISLNNSYLGIDLYDSNWNLLERDTLISNKFSSPLNGKIIQFSDSVYIFCYHNYDQMKIKKMDLDFRTVKEITISNSDISYYDLINILKIDDSSFWLEINYKLYQYSINLEPLGQITNKVYPETYLGDNKFVYAFNNFGYGSESNKLFGNIYTANQDTLVKNFYIADNVNEYNITRLPDNGFLVVFKQDKKLFARAFSPEGKARMDSFLIHSNIESLKKLPAVLVNSNKIYFAWSDNRNIGNGYDIYGSVFDYSSIVEVKENNFFKPESYSLSQNYPNPFNPVTRIKYSIPENVHVILKVYNILGKEIASLVNEEKSAGNYTIDFNASKLSSGIYFYKITAGRFNGVKKFMLLK